MTEQNSFEKAQEIIRLREAIGKQEQERKTYDYQAGTVKTTPNWSINLPRPPQSFENPEMADRYKKPYIHDQGPWNAPVTIEGIKQPPPYWNQASRIGRYYFALQSLPPDAPIPDWVDKEGIEAAYNYLKETKPNEHWTNWGEISPDDPLNIITSQMLPPPPNMMPSWERETLQKRYEALHPPGEYTPDPAAREMSGSNMMLESQYKDLPIWKKGAQALIPVIQYGFAGLGGAFMGARFGLGGAVVGATGMMGGTYIAAQIQKKIDAGEEITDQEKDFLTKFALLDWAEIQAEKTGGLSQQIWASLFKPEKYGELNEIFGSWENLKAAYDAGAIFYESFMSAAEKKPVGWEEDVANQAKLEQALYSKDNFWQNIFKPDAEKFNKTIEELYGEGYSTEEALKIAMGYKQDTRPKEKDSVIVGAIITSDEDIVTRLPNGQDATPYFLKLARDKIQKGENANDVYLELSQKFGYWGGMRDLMGSLLLDPLDQVGPATNKMLSTAGKIAGKPTLTEAFIETHRSPIDNTRLYGQLVRSKTPAEAAQYSAFSRWVAGIDKAGNVKAMTKLQGNPFNWLFGLTPKAKASHMLTTFMDSIYNLVAPEKDIKVFTNMIETISRFSPEQAIQGAEGPTMKITVGGEAVDVNVSGWYMSTEAQLLPTALKDSIQPMKELVDTYNLADGTNKNGPRQIINRIAEYMGSTPEDFIATLHKMKPDEANAMYNKFLITLGDLKTKGDPNAGKLLDILVKRESSKKWGEIVTNLTGAEIQKMANIFFGDKGVPFSPEILKFRILEAIETSMSKWAVDYFGVKPDPALLRLSNVTKKAQSLLLLGLNPGYFFNNAINNLVTMQWDGILHLGYEYKRQQYMEDFGIIPIRYEQGYGAAEYGQINSGQLQMLGMKSKPVGTEINKASHSQGGFINNASELMGGKFESVQVFARWSQSFEKWNSQIAIANGIAEYMNRAHRVGKGIPKMPDGLKAMLEEIKPGLAKRVEKMIERNISKAKIEKTIWGEGGPATSIRDFLDPDAIQALDHFGILKEVDERLTKATTPDQIYQVFQDVKNKLQEEINNQVIRNMKKITNDVAAKSQIEGPQGVLDLYDTLTQMRVDFWIRHFDFMAQVAETASSKKGIDRALIWMNGKNEAGQNWRGFTNIEGAKTLGILTGMGLDRSKPLYLESFNLIANNQLNWDSFFKKQQELWIRFESESNGIEWNDPARTGLWNKLNEDISTEYLNAALKEEATQARLDQIFADLYEKQFPGKVAEAEKWRNAVGTQRHRMIQAQALWRTGTIPEMLLKWGDLLGPEIKDAMFKISGGNPIHTFNRATRDKMNPIFYKEIYTKLIRDISVESNKNAPGMPEIQPETPTTPTTPPQGEGIPVFITQKMRNDLTELGYLDADIRAMTPEDAWEVINNSTRKIEPEGPSPEEQHLQSIMGEVESTALEGRIPEGDLFGEAPTEAPAPKKQVFNQSEREIWKVVNESKPDLNPIDEGGQVVPDARLNLIKYILKHSVSAKRKMTVGADGKWTLHWKDVTPDDLRQAIAMEQQAIDAQPAMFGEEAPTIDTTTQPMSDEEIAQVNFITNEPITAAPKITPEQQALIDAQRNYDRAVQLKEDLEYQMGNLQNNLPPVKVGKEAAERVLLDHLKTIGQSDRFQSVRLVWEGFAADWARNNPGTTPADWYETFFVGRGGDSSDAAGLSQMRYNQELISTAIDYFGTTQNIREAGFIMPDGTLLDLSGRRDAGGYKKVGTRYMVEKGRDYLANQRATDHREVIQFMPYNKERSLYEDRLAHFMAETGAIRIDANSQIVDAASKLTREQISVIKDYFDEYTHFDITDPKTGQLIESINPNNRREFNAAIQKINDTFKQTPRQQEFDELYQEVVTKKENRMVIHLSEWEENYARALLRQTDKEILSAIYLANTKDEKIHLFAALNKQDPVRAKQVYDLAMENKPFYLWQEDTGSNQWYNYQSENIINNLMPNKADKNQIKAILKGKVKQEELDTIGLNDWLDQQTGKIAKEDVLDFIEKNNLQVEEVSLGSRGNVDREYWDIVNTPHDQITPEQVARMREIESMGRDQTRYGQYTMKGGDNYHELLIKLPFREDSRQAIRKRIHDDWVRGIISTEERNKRILASDSAPSQEPFISSHWREEPNVVAHARFQDYTDVDGKRVLLIEEIQSDWHQKGREQGYKSDKKTYALYDENGYLVATNQSRDELIRIANEQKITPDIIEAQEFNTAVPDAPFKTTWPELVMKRMIRWAAENGYDRVAWTPGEIQAARYNLAKQIDRLDWTYKEGEETGVLHGYKDGGQIIRQEISQKQLPDYIGKDAAKKLLEKEPDWDGPNRYGYNRKGLSGEKELSVGGAGMRKFYDEMIPSKTKKYIKKWNSELTEIELSNGQKVPAFDVTPEMRDAVMTQGQSLFQQKRGATRWADDGLAVMHLFNNADVSTIVHETVHVYTPQMSQAHSDLVRTWLKNEYKMDLPEDWHLDPVNYRDASEKLATGFEKYLAEGKSPIPSLNEVFASFKQWMLEIYKKITGSDIDVKLDANVRKVFDEWMAGDKLEELKNASTKPPLDWAEYIKLKDTMNEERLYIEAGTVNGVKVSPEYMEKIKSMYAKHKAIVDELDKLYDKPIGKDILKPENIEAFETESPVTRLPDPEPQETMFSGKKPRQEGFFDATGEDLPLLSGTAQRGQADIFAPQEIAPQDALFDMRQQLPTIEGRQAVGGAEGTPLFGEQPIETSPQTTIIESGGIDATQTETGRTGLPESGRTGTGVQSGGIDSRRSRDASGRLIIARSERTKAGNAGLVPQNVLEHLAPHQADGVAKAIEAFQSDVPNKRGFILADGTGAGKTRQELAIAKTYADQGRPVVIVTKAEVIKANWKKNTFAGSFKNDADTMGMKLELSAYPPDVIEPGKVYLSTYERMENFYYSAGIDDAIIIFDEAHALKNADSKRTQAGIALTNRAHAVVYASATPADKPQHIDYMARANIFEGKGRDQAYRELGLTQRKIKVGKGRYQKEIEIWVVDSSVGSTEVYKRMGQLFDRMTENGNMIKREISMDGIPVQFNKLPIDAAGKAILQKIEDAFSDGGSLNGLKKALVLMHQRRQQEPMKIPVVKNMVKQELDAGRQVVVFLSRVNDSDVIKRTKMWGSNRELVDIIEEVIHSSEGTVKTLKKELEAMGIKDIAELHGGSKEAAPDSMDKFQTGKARVMLATLESGGTGINLDDITGNAPRTIIFMTAPFSAVENIQGAGRVWRMTTKSQPKIIYLFGDTPTDQWNAAIIAEKMKMLGATVEGEVRKLDIPEDMDADLYLRKLQEDYGNEPKDPATYASPLEALGHSRSAVLPIGKTVIRPFEVDERLIVNNPNVGSDMEVIYRGKVDSGRSMVYDPKGGGQFTVENQWLKRKGELYQEGLQKEPKTFAYDSKNQKLEFETRIVSLDELITSHTDALGEDPRYPQELQPRKRDRAASQEQIDKIAKTLEPDQMIVDFHTTDRGSPIVGSDLIVESGNGRTIALRRARAAYPENWAKYQEAVKLAAQEYGLSTEGIEDPVLVRERITEVNREKFASDANDPTSAQFSDFEYALKDQKYITDQMLSDLKVAEKEEVEKAIFKESNADIVRDFVKNIPTEELNRIMTPDGRLSPAGAKRIINAMLLKIYPDEAGQRLLSVLVDMGDEGIKNLNNVLIRTMGEMAALEGAVNTGKIPADYALANDLTKAIDVYARLRQQNVHPNDYINQTSIFDRELDDFQSALLLFIHDNRRSEPKLRNMISMYVKSALDQPPAGQESMLTPRSTKGEILDGIAKKLGKETDFASTTRAEEVTPAAISTTGEVMDSTIEQPAAEPVRPQPEEPVARPIPEPIEETEQPAVGAPFGTADQILPPPYDEMLYEGWLKDIMPALDDAQNKMMSADIPDKKSLGSQLTKDQQKELRKYLGNVYSELTSTKMAAIQYAMGKRDFALHDYTKRTGADNILGGFFPYQFWYTRSALNWFARLATNPGILADYYRIMTFGQQSEDREGYPNRLKGKIGIPVPFLPDWMGKNIYVDPFKQIYPFRQLTAPFRQMQDEANMLNKKTMGIIQQQLEDGEITDAQAEEAVKQKSGEVWDKAMRDVRASSQLEFEKPLDYATALISPSLPLSLAINLSSWGDKKKISQLPVTRLIQSVTSMLGFGGPRGWNIEAPFRKGFGLDEVDQYETYRINRELSNMVADGLVDPQVAIREMVDGKGPNYEAAKVRVAKQMNPRTFFSSVGLDFFPEGEQEMRSIAVEYGNALDAYFDGGDKEALTKFWDEFPEYESRIASNNTEDPEKMLRTFLRSRIWQQFNDMNSYEKQQAVDALGQTFELSFLNKDTRNYDDITTETYASWAKTLGAEMPESYEDATEIPGAKIPEEASNLLSSYLQERDQKFPGISDTLSKLYSLDVDSQAMMRKNTPIIEEYQNWRNKFIANNPAVAEYLTGEQSELYGLPPQIQVAVYQYRDQVNDYFPNIYDTQSAYFDITNSSQKKNYLKQHPELTAYWDYRREYAAAYPQAAPYILSDESLAKYILGEDRSPQTQEVNIPAEQDFDPALLRLLASYYYNGRELPSGARAELNRLWKNAGSPAGSMENWLNAYIWPVLK